MGNGRRIRFWEDVWWGEVPFSSRFVDLYRLSLASNSTIAVLLVLQNGITSHWWNLHFYRHMRSSELENFVNLSVILDQVSLNTALEDLRIWIPDISGGFSCKSATAVLHYNDGRPDFQFHKFIWKANIPVRVRFFAWTLCLERINTYDVL